jgi:hypothetical protein
VGADRLIDMMGEGHVFLVGKILDAKGALRLLIPFLKASRFSLFHRRHNRRRSRRRFACRRIP